MGANKKNVTLAISREVHKNFKIENARNGTDMSEVVENFMINYIKSSIKLNNQMLENDEQ